MIALFSISFSAALRASAGPETPATPAVQFRCEPQKILRSSHSTYYNRKNATYWVATDKKSAALFKRLKFRLIARKKELRIKGLKYSAVAPCPLNIDFTKIYLAPHGADSLKVTNACEEQIAVDLGFHLSGMEGENLGSLDTGHPIAWRSLFVCTTGAKFTTCDRPTLEMQNCLAQLR